MSPAPPPLGRSLAGLRLAFFWAFLGTLALGLWPAGVRSWDASPTAPAARGVRGGAPPDPVALLRRFECSRCHEGAGAGAGVEPAPQAKQCVGCHRQILDGRFEGTPAELGRWRRNLVSLRAAPSLAGIGNRLRRDWVRAFLLDPEVQGRDLRPASAATMPRLPISDGEATALAAYLVPVEAAPQSFAGADPHQGRQLYRRFACDTCHSFRAVGLAARVAAHPVPRGQGLRAPPDAVALAPDLSLTPARFQSGRLVEWLRDPQRLSPGSAMPGSGLGVDDARHLAAFIMTAPRESAAAPVPRAAPAPAPRRVPVLRRRVAFAEVERRVFRKVCWHCHAQPAYALGDGGPGNTGGFGYAPRGLDLSTYEGIASGSIGRDGRRQSIFRLVGGAGAPPVPELVARLVARREEVAGRPGETIGMPLGLPPLGWDEIQLVETWIAQGRPR